MTIDGYFIFFMVFVALIAYMGFLTFRAMVDVAETHRAWIDVNGDPRPQIVRRMERIQNPKKKRAAPPPKPPAPKPASRPPARPAAKPSRPAQPRRQQSARPPQRQQRTKRQAPKQQLPPGPSIYRDRKKTSTRKPVTKSTRLTEAARVCSSVAAEIRSGVTRPSGQSTSRTSGPPAAAARSQG